MNKLDSLAAINELSSADFDTFRTAVKTLTTKTFIIRAIERERELYDFTIRNITLFESYFFCMEAEVLRDESLGVIAFRGQGAARLYFSREEICAALTLRLLYEDKKLEASLTAFPAARVEDFKQKYKAVCGEEIKKTNLFNVLRRLSVCKLITFNGADSIDNEALILMYPSVPFLIDRAALDDALAYIAGIEAKGTASENGANEDGASENEAGMEEYAYT